MKHVIVIPPKDDGFFVTRELGDSMFNNVNYNPYNPIVYATKLRDEEHENVTVIDAQAMNLNYEQTKFLVRKQKPDIVTYFLSAFSIPNDVKCVDWNAEKEFFVSPFQVDVSELLQIYPEYPFEKEEFIKNPNILTGKADFSFVDLSKYHLLRININDFCPFQCAYCCRSGTVARLKPVEDTVEEIEYILNKYGRRELFLFTSEISLKKDMIFELTEKLLGKNLILTTMDRVDLVEREVYEKLVRAGLRNIQLGIESGSQRCLDSVNKGIKVDDAIRAFDELKTFKELSKRAFFIVGFPIEGWADLWASIKLAWKIQPDELSVEIFYPSPSSPVYTEMKKQGKLKTLRWEYYKHHKRRTLVFHHNYYRNYRDLLRTKNLVTMFMDIGILSRNLSRRLARQFKNEALSLLRTLKNRKRW